MLYLDEDEEGQFSDGPGGNIGDGSCNYLYGCLAFRGTVGNGSCNSFAACTYGWGTVHDGSCGRSDSSYDFPCWSIKGESPERQEASNNFQYFLTILSSFTHLPRHCARQLMQWRCCVWKFFWSVTNRVIFIMLSELLFLSTNLLQF